jgi:hypothetical protein
MNDLLSEDSNQFGPGADLMISLLALLLVMTLVSSHLYRKELYRREQYRNELARQEQLINEMQRKEKERSGHDNDGDFVLATDYFSAGDFYSDPVTKLRSPQETNRRIEKIVQEYDQSKADFQYIFVIGHSNQLDDPTADDKSQAGRLQRNWGYAGRRAAVIAALIQEHLTLEQKDNLVVITTGEFDLKVPSSPISQENAWVEVVFAKKWKPPARKALN